LIRRSDFVALLLALQATVAGACGHCIEDKVASVYDYAIVTKALQQKHHVAYFAIEGPLVPDASTERALTAMIESTGGVDKGSARVSVESAALSFGFDPRRVPLGKVVKSLEASLAARGLSLLPLQVMDRSLSGKRDLQ